jgi:subtilisin family serine protease
VNVSFRAARLSAFAALLMTLAACASAAGPARPRTNSLEYRLSWGLETVNAKAAYRAGATGRGVTIALVDCGLEHAQPELRRNVSARSVDLNPRRADAEPMRHADYVAGPLGSALDGRGLVGVAYNATLLSVRADFDGGWNGQCAFRPDDVARGLDYARANGARIAVLPLQASRPLGARFETALQRALDSGMAVVIAAGNGAEDQPSWPARYAADSRFAGGVVVVGAARADGSFAEWSNRAGAAAPYYVTAPGEGIITDCGRRYCKRVSGTSLAAPYVAGALALISEARPDLDGRDAIDLLLRSAHRPAEADLSRGRGLLDIGQAFVLLKHQAPAG